MKITRIGMGEQRTSGADGIVDQDFCLYLFRSGVLISINGDEHLYGGGTAILYSSGSRQRFRGLPGKGLKYDMVCFRMSSTDKQYASSVGVPFNKPLPLLDEFIIATAIKSMEIYRNDFTDTGAEADELFMRIILLRLSEAADKDKAEQRGIPKYNEMKKLREEIYDEPMQAWKVDSACKLLEISRTYFHRLYLSAFGVTFQQDVIESRLLYASELLRETDLSVNEIAEMCGYESDSYFMRQFKQHRGCTPTDYRRKR